MDMVTALAVRVAHVISSMCRLILTRGPDRNDLHAGQHLQDARFGHLSAVELDMDDARRTGLGFQHTLERPELLADGARTTLVANALHFPQGMTVAFADRRAGTLDHLADAGEWHDVRVMVDAQLRRRAVRSRAQVHLHNAIAAFQIVDQPPDAGVGLVRHLR
ncbi:hypothetical protein [Aerolutibacter ruishenii]|uniref:hypothetical protein n=1 Tax=Aerolutibacter ruishenii TaxID=686800 RepID=UPI001F557452|nr:hypothetical protein [Lysobacter ruishenii]